MTDIIQLDTDTKQPGDDNLEGASNKYGEYIFTYKSVNGGLFIQVKDKKTKRKYAYTFSKDMLMQMKLNQSVSEIISMIKMARSGLSQKINFQFQIRFGSPLNEENAVTDEEEQTQYHFQPKSVKPMDVDPNELSETYTKGDALYVIVMVKEAFWNCNYLFPLTEQDVPEIDRLGDIIEDLREEIAKCKQNKSHPVAVYKCSTPGSPVPWNVVHIASTMQGMTTTQDNNESIVIGIPGRYAISTRFGLTEGWADYLKHELKLNDQTIAYAMSYQAHSVCFNEVLDLNQGDKLQYALNTTVNNSYWNRNCNDFRLEYLGDE